MNPFVRRQFLMGSAAVAAMAQNAPERIPTAMIGVGGRGSGLLREVLAQADAKVAMLCDLKPDRLDKAATAAGRDNPTTTTEWRRVIDRKDIEAVYIATPPHLHAQMAIAALESGKHVYCEKPIGVNAADVKSIVKAARASKNVFTSGQQLRSHRILRGAIEKIQGGVIGSIAMVKAQRHATNDHPADSSSADWYFDVAKSGGYLIEQSVHNLDLCNWVIGSRPVAASGFGGTQIFKNTPPGRNIFDCANLSYDYANGVKMSFTQNVFHPRGMPAGGQYVFVFGDKGAVDLMYATMLYPANAPLMEKADEPPHAHTAAFFRCIRGQGPNPADVTIGATAALTAILGHEAMVKQKVVRWTDLGVDV
jgi:myo-inositol 2-dehydrogenase / D-chiro-inositol 1-dehydrogenase